MGLTGYERYAKDLTMLAMDLRRGSWEQLEQDVHNALNGQASQKLRDLVPRNMRRQEGAFFTNGSVKAKFANLLDDSSSEDKGDLYWDPTCGAGDLLLTAIERFPLGRTLADTLRMWGTRIWGHDIQASFVEVAQLRLFLAAASRHRFRGDKIRVSPDSASRVFRNVQVGDGLSALQGNQGFRGRLLLNPPFGPTLVGADCTWASGLTSQAAIFFLSAAKMLVSPGGVAAILPDVLRSGSRYKHWRSQVSKLISIEEIAPHGQFDSYTDVDVFLLRGKRFSVEDSLNPPGRLHWWEDLDSETRVGDAFDVRIGPVVDNRDPHEGPEAPFLTARGMPSHGEMGLPSRKRRFAGRLLMPPFVAVRRTSRPGPGTGGVSRMAGVIINGTQPVAVDNHLITLKPMGDEREKCVELLKVLASDEVAAWLDERIRCRHMTVGIVRSLPWR